MRDVHFTILQGNPYAANYYGILHTSYSCNRNHTRQTFTQSVQGLRSSIGP